MKEPVMMEVVRLRKGDMLVNESWEIIDEEMVYQPNTSVQVNALGHITEGEFKKVLRLKFYSAGAWYGYIFPESGLAVAVKSNGYHEHIVWEKKLEPVMKVIERDPPPLECQCSM
ncbi:hypothetical protein D3C86_1813870 [compost metagenome]